MSTGAIIALVIAIAAVVVFLVAVGGSKWGHKRGYSGMGGDTIARCSQGHLFMTLWIPGASLKAVRLGFKRYQLCPVCGKWRIVEPVPDSELTDEDRLLATQHHDTRLP
ncbi:MAG: hypothetical protein ABSG39_00640 [Acidimicrobiales bacterium]|jgi:hypothetical protein